jgi:dienelactone hydrolase
MAVESAVQIPPIGLQGDLVVPRGAEAIVVFAHGSGSSRHSSRNRYVAGELQHGGLATLLMDLLTEQEEEIDVCTRRLRFDIGLLAERLVYAMDWLKSYSGTSALRIGLFGASTGAGAALMAAAQRPELVSAVVSRGGRPDLAGTALPQVRCPTLLLVGSRDEPVIEMNETAKRQIAAMCRLEIIPNATHLFEEPGTLEQVSVRAREWFQEHLQPAAEQQPRM